MSIKRIVFNCFIGATKPIVKCFFHFFVRKPIIVYKFDGGTCSQLKCYMCYKYLEEQGYPVMAGLGWYRENKFSIDDVCNRTYNIDKLFDLEPVNAVAPIKELIYRFYFYYEPKLNGTNKLSIVLDEERIKLKAPCYMGGEYDLKNRVSWLKRFGKFRSAEEIFDGKIPDILREIWECKNTVGVHVRRGDMSRVTSKSHWTVIPKEYFINVCKIEEIKEFTFFFFSEEPGWIRENIIPYVDIEYRVVDSNSAYYGYRDLFMLSQCKYQVTSQGSFGYYAYLFNANKEKKGILYDINKSELWRWID